MSISAPFGATLISSHPNASLPTATKSFPGTTAAAGVIECSSRPRKKATAHHMKTRPRKSQPWDIKRGPTVYAPLPPLPPDWTLVSPAPDSSDASSSSLAEEDPVPSPP